MKISYHSKVSLFQYLPTYHPLAVLLKIENLIDVLFYLLHPPLAPCSRHSREKKHPRVRLLEGNGEIKDLNYIHKLDNQSQKY